MGLAQLISERRPASSLPASFLRRRAVVYAKLPLWLITSHLCGTVCRGRREGEERREVAGEGGGT